ncbi:Uncharacterized protein TCM_019115 [Theobroma cacao]|uniref:Uncharacterized protein n=1 Tax=Theobroma cacao TaxID=3641 RepID=A0A061EHK9_THECC|nr:Uncharacterized protein TCM_019115 [Theobroma cacao]
MEKILSSWNLLLFVQISMQKVLGILPASTSRMLRLEIDVNKLQTFILECPAALKRLPLLRIWNLLGHLLKIDAPNFRSVELDSMPRNNSSERSRHLANACPYLMADHVNEDKSKNFILSCPSLERLAQLRHLKIHGPNLKYLEVGTGLENISIENTLNLVSFTISLGTPDVPCLIYQVQRSMVSSDCCPFLLSSRLLRYSKLFLGNFALLHQYYLAHFSFDNPSLTQNEVSKFQL